MMNNCPIVLICCWRQYFLSTIFRNDVTSCHVTSRHRIFTKLLEYVLLTHTIILWNCVEIVESDLLHLSRNYEQFRFSSFYIEMYRKMYENDYLPLSKTPFLPRNTWYGRETFRKCPKRNYIQWKISAGLRPALICSCSLGGNFTPH